MRFVDETSWYGLLVPKGTPKEIVAKINADVQRVLAQPDVKEKGVTLGYRYVGGSPEKLEAFLWPARSPNGRRSREARR